MGKASEDQPLVTVVIPVYNGSNYLREAIDSALVQTYPNIEIIVVNDGSNDNGETHKIALSYGNKIRYFNKKTNGGVSTALNLAIKNMHGQYFSWLSHDDVYYPDKIECQINALKKAGDMSLSVYSARDSLVMPSRKVLATFPLREKYAPEQIESGLFAVVNGLINGCALLIHKRNFLENGLFDESLKTTQDYDMWFRLFHNKKLLYVDKPLLQSRNHIGQGTYTNPVYQSECDDLYLDMMSKIDYLNGLEILGTKYEFYLYMFLRAKVNEWEKCKKYTYNKFLKEEEPINIDDRIKFFLDKLNHKCKNFSLSICLYGAGKIGAFAFRNLENRNIKVKNFSDSNPLLWGKKIGRLECISPSEINKENTLVIVTPVYGFSQIKQVLQRNGVKHVIAWDEIEPIIYKVPIRKEKIAQKIM